MEGGHGICILFSATTSGRLGALCFHLFATIWLLHVVASSAQDSLCQNMAPSPTLTPFVDALPIPPSIAVNNLTTLTISSYKITQVTIPTSSDPQVEIKMNACLQYIIINNTRHHHFLISCRTHHEFASIDSCRDLDFPHEQIQLNNKPKYKHLCEYSDFFEGG
jgi:hypothetical protein